MQITRKERAELRKRGWRHDLFGWRNARNWYWPMSDGRRFYVDVSERAYARVREHLEAIREHGS